MTCKQKVLGIKCEFHFSHLSEYHSDQYWVRDAQERCVQVRQWKHHRALNSYMRCQCQFKYLYHIMCSCVCQKQLVKSSLVMRILIRYLVMWCTISARDTSNCIILLIFWRIKNLVPKSQIQLVIAVQKKKFLEVSWNALIHSMGNMSNFIMLQQLVHIVTTAHLKLGEIWKTKNI